MVTSVYHHVAKIEIGYRGMRNPVEDVLVDTIESCLCIMGRRGIRPEEYQKFIDGINSIPAVSLVVVSGCVIRKLQEKRKANLPEALRIIPIISFTDI